LSASRTPPTLALPRKGGGEFSVAAIPYTSPLAGEVCAQRREGGRGAKRRNKVYCGAPKGICGHRREA